MAKIARIFLPFLYVRNWYTGKWELSRARMLIAGAALILILAACIVIIMLQAPVSYDAT